MALRLLAACIAALVLAMTLLAGAPGAIDEEVTGNEDQVDAPQEDVVLLIADLYGTLAPFLGIIAAIAVLVVLMIRATSL